MMLESLLIGQLSYLLILIYNFNYIIHQIMSYSKREANKII
jgi:hypothetical protein